MSSSKVLFFLCTSFIVGIFFESVFKIPQIFVWGILILGVLLICAFFTRVKNAHIFSVAGFCLLFLVLGILRTQISEFNIANDKLSKLNGKGEITLTGVVSNEPDIRYNSQKLKIDVGGSTVLVTTEKYKEYKYLDKIKITGKLEAPFETEDFSYKNYLLKDHIYSVMAFPKIEVVSRKHEYNFFSFLYEKILFFKQKLRESIQKNFSPPQSEILQGTVLGDNGAMSNDLKNKLNITGLRHIIAVSGTHVVILASIVMSLLITMGFYRGQAFYIAIIFILIYIVLTGLPASGIRAGIMGGTYLLAQKLGRQSGGLRLIVMACALMLAINPLLLIYDVGFQLSFLAVMGLIYLEPLIKIFVKNSILSTTFAAQIFTLPIMVYNFGNISFVSPITNLLVLPIVYWLMIFGFLVSFAGVFFNALSWVLSIPCWILLTYFVRVIDFFSQPWAVKTVENIHWVWLLISYFIIGSLVYYLKRKYRHNFL